MEFGSKLNLDDPTTLEGVLKVVQYYVRVGASDARISTALGGLCDEDVAKLRLILEVRAADAETKKQAAMERSTTHKFVPRPWHE